MRKRRICFSSEKNIPVAAACKARNEEMVKHYK